MKKLLAPNMCFILFKLAGLSLLFAYWIMSGKTSGFFLLLFLIVMSLLRQRIPKLELSVFVDFAVCAVLYALGELPGIIMAIALFEAVYLEYYWVAFSVLYAYYHFSFSFTAIFALNVICGFFLSCWNGERKQKQHLRDVQAGRYYELEGLQNDLVAALAQIEKMTALHERARIARDIHDNAGHEIVAAYMSFQTVRDMLYDSEMLELYDTALERLNSGTEKIREAVHNLGAVNFSGVERLREKCNNFTICEVDFKIYGDTERIPIYIWSMLESCLSEALTNIARHSSAVWAAVELDATPHIVRLCVTNDGVHQIEKTQGSGLRNLSRRAAAIGGNLSVDSGEVFSVICVVPIRYEQQGG